MMRNNYFFLLLLVLFACTENDQAVERIIQGEAQGTTYTVKYLGEEKQDLKQELDSLLDVIDQSMSTWVPQSTISRLNQGDSVEVDSAFKAVFLLSKEIHRETDGAFDPGIGALIESWGFDYKNPQKMDSLKVDSLLGLSAIDLFVLEGNRIRKKYTGAKLNFNAIAQGYAVDAMAKILDEAALDNYYVELGGEVLTKGKNSKEEWWRIGIDKPSGENLERELSAIVSLKNRAMVTSGNYRKYLEIDGQRYSHSLNPKTGYPVKHNLLSATVFAPSAAEADAYATACMVMGLEEAKRFLESKDQLEGILIYNVEGELKTFATAGIAAQMELLD
jgi:thiamine biosynthesis lipoprotein